MLVRVSQQKNMLNCGYEFKDIDIEYNSKKEKEFYVNKFNELTSLGVGNHCGSLESINQFDIMILDNLQNKEVK